MSDPPEPAPGRRGGGGTGSRSGRYQRGAPAGSSVISPRATAAPAARNSTGGIRGGTPEHREGLRATSCPRAPAQRGLCVRRAPAANKGGSQRRGFGGCGAGAAPFAVPVVSPSPPRCPRAPRGVPVPPLAAAPAARGWHPRRRRWHMEPGGHIEGTPRVCSPTPVCAPPPPGHPWVPFGGDSGPTCASSPRCFSFGD